MASLREPFFSTGDSNSIKERGAKATSDLGTFIVSLANESSLGLYRINEHASRKVPLIVQQKRDITQLTEQVIATQAAVNEAIEIVRDMATVDSFTKCAEYAQRIKTSKREFAIAQSGAMERRSSNRHR
ncbi:hypothetical protein HDU88_001443 [Geranomyces variabilis]|nr:hypothetical protein HDU88_001443 [Geranomyces variabilis]